MSLITIAAYQFIRLDNLPELRDKLKAKTQELGFKGTILLAPEGINCFIAGEPQCIPLFKDYLVNELKLDKLTYKENHCTEYPFVRMLVKIKKEIISFGQDDIQPDVFTGPYMSPAQLKSWLDEGKDFILLDTRNDYEVKIGTFEKATHLNVPSFREFGKVSKELPPEMKDKPVVMFCTGGIRCEKASAHFLNNGFKEVYQLEGGILKYFEDCNGAHYKGDCFVFDWRMAVNSELKPQPNSRNEDLGRHRILENPES
jgi:predicted sulfurtransferase